MNIRSLITIICLSSCLSILANPAQTLYCTLLGNHDASPRYQAIIRKALEELNVPHTDQVAIKKMNAIAPTLFGNDLCSFTAFGIWVNEELLEECSNAVQTFQLTHEAAHYARGDHQQILKQCALLPLAYGAIGYASSKLPLPTLGRIAAGIAASAAVTCGFIEWTLRPLVKAQEKEADLEALRLLTLRGDRKSIEQYKRYLRALIAAGYGNDTDGWHPTIAEQADYIQ